MKIILNELKKIFSFKMVCLLILGSTIFYTMFISFEIENFPNGRPHKDDYNIMVQMIKDYGQEMDETELQHFKNLYAEKLLEADEFLSDNEDFNKVGIYSYNDYLKVEDKSFFENKNEEYEDVKWDYLRREEGTIFWELQQFPSLIGFYEDRDNYSSVDLDGKKFEKRINEIIKNNENESLLTWIVFDNYNYLIGYFGVCIVIGVSFMLTPIFLKDKKDKISYLQYSSKHGRKLFTSKLIAGIIAAIIIITIELIICFILYKGNNTEMFFRSNINSVFNNSFWVNITFIQYIMITVVGVYIIGIITAFTSMFISSKAHSYIDSIGVQVPTLFIIGGLTYGVLLNNLFILYIPKYLALLIYLVLTIVVAAVIVNSVRSEIIIDIKG